MMDPGSMMAFGCAAYFLLLGGFAALATARALEEGDAEGLARRVFVSLTRTTFLLGLPGLIAFLAFLNSESRGQGGGIMSRDMGLFVLFVLGFLGLFAIWTAAITMGFVASLAVKTMKPRIGAAVMVAFLAAAPSLAAMTYARASWETEQRRLHHQ